MKTKLSFAKVTLFVIIFSAFTTSCPAQKLLSELKDGETVKAVTKQYMVKKIRNVIVIERTDNRFINVRQNSPNLPINISPSKFDIILDKVQLAKICSKYLDIQQLETMVAGDKYGGINVYIRTDITGKILEVGFYTEQKGNLLNLNQLEQIDNNIRSSILVTIKPEIVKYLEGSNFWLCSPLVLYSDILKVKKESIPSQRTKDPRRL